MAFLGKKFIAGAESLGGKYRSGIAFTLSKKSSVSYVHEITVGSWQVEFSKDSTDVIARTTAMLNLEALQSNGFEAIQSALDILSVNGILSTYITSPATTNIGVYFAKSRSIAYLHSICDFPMSINCEVHQADASGKAIIAPPPPEPIWNESFRYYRLSQSSTDLFEAYRNLFLALEALLNPICPKKHR